MYPKSSLRQDFNAVHQIGYLKNATGINSDWVVILHALSIAQASLEQAQKGRDTHIWNRYSDGFSLFYRLRGDFSKETVLEKVRRQPVDETAQIVSFEVNPLAKKLIADVGQMSGLKKDEHVISYALQLAYDLATEVRSCPGKAFVCFGDDLESINMRRLTTQFDKTISGAVKRVKNRVVGKARSIVRNIRS